MSASRTFTRPHPLVRAASMLRTSASRLAPRDVPFLLARLAVLAAGRASLPLDAIFQAGYKDVPVERPVFILGHPRSGTTFLHRLITQTEEFPAFQTWELLVPSLTARKLLGPLVPGLVRLLGKGFHDASAVFAEDAHEVRIDSIEEEELLFLFSMDSQFLLLFTALGFVEQDPWDLVYPDRQPKADRDASMALFRGCLQRQIHATGRTRVVAKMPYSTLRVRTLLEHFPDARIVYLVRSPLETIPSHLSLHHHLFTQLYGPGNVPAELMERYWDRRYRFNVELYRYFRDVEEARVIPDDQLLVVRYPELQEDLGGVFERCMAFAGIEPSSALQAAVGAQAARQSSYRRGHTNQRVEEFGISQERVMADLGWVYDAYRLPRP
ncbi:MAG: sulfotransferase [Polyangiaceae bacterium]|nr:sulfotransferase [Polyangiaceae bacterium]